MTFQGFVKYPLVFSLAFLIAYLIVPLVSKAVIWVGLLDSPDARRIHKNPIPRGGGVAVFVGFHAACALLFLFPWESEFATLITPNWWLSFACVSLFLLLWGLLDDAIQLRWFVKLGGQIVAGLLMFYAGTRIREFQGISLPFYLDLVLTLFWFLALTNAFNLIDGLDGLASGLAVIAALGLAGALFIRQLPGDSLILLALAGASLAFLRYNFHPASIFLGDSGSMFLGFTLASLSLATSAKGTTLAALGVPLLAVGVPMFDTILAIWRRSVRVVMKDLGLLDGTAEGIAHADMDHIHHRLIKAGFNQRKVAVSLYVLNAALVGVGLLSLIFHSHSSGIFLIAFVLGSYVVVKHLASVELWDSGTALLHGLRRPKQSSLPTLAYPVIDALALCIALFIAIFFAAPNKNLTQVKNLWLMQLPLGCGLPFIALFFADTYRRVWSRARISEFVLVVGALSGGVLIGFSILSFVHNKVPHFFTLELILYWCFSGASISAIRAIPRTIQDLMDIFDIRRVTEGGKNIRNVLIYGAGYRGLLYLKHKSFSLPQLEVFRRIVGFVDDDHNLRKRLVHGYKVHGTFMELAQVVTALEVHEVIVACDLPEDRMEKLILLAGNNKCEVKEFNINENLISSTNDLQEFYQKEQAVGD